MTNERNERDEQEMFDFFAEQLAEPDERLDSVVRLAADMVDRIGRMEQSVREKVSRFSSEQRQALYQDAAELKSLILQRWDEIWPELEDEGAGLLTSYQRGSIRAAQAAERQVLATLDRMMEMLR